MESTHGQAADGTALLFGDGAVAAVDELHDLREGFLEGAFHSLGQAHRRVHITVGILQRGRLAGDVAVGEDHNHRLGLTAGDEVVQDLGGTALGYPGVFVTTDAVKHIQHGVLGLGGLVAGRRVHGETAVETSRSGRIPDLGNGAVGHFVDGIEVAALAGCGNQQHAGEAGHIPVHPHIVRINLRNAVHAESVVVHIGSHDKGSGVLPNAAFPFFEHAHARGIIGHLVAVELHFHLFGRKEIAGHFHLDGLGSHETEGDGTVFIDDGRLHTGATPEGLLGMGTEADGQSSHCDKEFLHTT